MMRGSVCIVLILLGWSLPLPGILVAEFDTNRGKFSVDMDYINAPLACANFVLLSGKGDDIWETPPGAASLTSTLYYSTAESDSARPALNVRYVSATPGFPERYELYQQNTLIGSVDYLPGAGGVHRDIMGHGRFELSQIRTNPNQYRIVFKYPRPWVDARFQFVREAPMFQNIPVTRIEPGRRFYSGSFTTDDFETPGYHFQDENIRFPGNRNNPYGSVFNSPWILAMDSHGPNTNGSRFFITSISEPNWNGKYTPIGVVQQNIGRQVILDIVNSAVEVNGQPVDPVIIRSISFNHIGGGINFIEAYHQNSLPGLIEPMSLQMNQINGKTMLVGSRHPGSQSSVYYSTDLRNYHPGFIGAQALNVIEPPSFEIPSVIPKMFFKGYYTQMLNWPSEEIDFDSARYSFKVTSQGASGSLSMNCDLDPNSGLISIIYQVDTEQIRFLENGDSYTHVTQGSGTAVATYDHSVGPYQGKLSLSVTSGPLDFDEFILNFESPPATASVVLRSFSATKSGHSTPADGYSGNFLRLN